MPHDLADDVGELHSDHLLAILIIFKGPLDELFLSVTTGLNINIVLLLPDFKVLVGLFSDRAVTQLRVKDEEVLLVGHSQKVWGGLLVVDRRPCNAVNHFVLELVLLDDTSTRNVPDDEIMVFVS